MRGIKNILRTGIVFLYSMNALAGDMQMQMGRGTDMANLPGGEPLVTGANSVAFALTCWPINLRNTGAFLPTDSLVLLHYRIRGTLNPTENGKDYLFAIPSWVVGLPGESGNKHEYTDAEVDQVNANLSLNPGGLKYVYIKPNQINDVNGARVTRGDQRVVFDIPELQGAPLSTTSDLARFFNHSYSGSGSSVKESWGVEKTFAFAKFENGNLVSRAGGGFYYAYSRWSGNIKLNQEKNGIILRIGFPAAGGVCGSFISPLMFFFDDKKPTFSGKSNFAIRSKNEGQHYWPEAKAPGYFLALDNKGDKKILDGTQLFGESDKHQNGFLALAELDTNKDGVINSKDKNFSKLVLWRDENGDGISQKDEVKSLKDMGVLSIDLKFKAGSNEPVAERAELRERSAFEFKRDGKIQKGEIVDVWFASVSGSK